MSLETNVEKKHMIAGCPHCRHNTLYIIKTISSLKILKPTEMLQCRTCKLMVFVDDLKDMLWSVWGD